MSVKTMKFKVGKGAAQKEAGAAQYTGPIPKSGSYRVVLKRLMIRENSRGDHMLVGLAEIGEKRGTPAARYNGYPIWFQQNITDQGAGYVNQILTALAKDHDPEEIKEAFWEEGPKVKQDERKDKNDKAQFHVRRIGDLIVNSPEIRDFEFVISGKYVNNRWGEKLEAQSYAPLGDYDEDAEDVSDEPTDYDEDEEPVKVAAAKKKKAKKAEPEPEPEEDEDEDEEEEDVEDGEDEDDEDDEDLF